MEYPAKGTKKWLKHAMQIFKVESSVGYFCLWYNSKCQNKKVSINNAISIMSPRTVFIAKFQNRNNKRMMRMQESVRLFRSAIK